MIITGPDMPFSGALRARPCALQERAGAALASSYIGRLEQNGAVVSPVQATALKTFFATVADLESRLIQVLVPVWGTAEPNALSLFFPSQPSYHAGAFDFTNKSQRVTSGFLYARLGPNFAPSAEGIASNSCGQCYFATATVSGPQCDMGVRSGGGSASNFSLYQFNGTVFAGAGTGTTIVQPGLSSPGLVAHNSTPGGQRLTFQSGGSVIELVTAAPATGPTPNGVMVAHCLHEDGIGPQYVAGDRAYGSFAWWKDFSHADADRFTDALYTLTTALRA